MGDGGFGGHHKRSLGWGRDARDRRKNERRCDDKTTIRDSQGPASAESQSMAWGCGPRPGNTAEMATPACRLPSRGRAASPLTPPGSQRHSPSQDRRHRVGFSSPERKRQCLTPSTCCLAGLIGGRWQLWSWCPAGHSPGPPAWHWPAAGPGLRLSAGTWGSHSGS